MKKERINDFEISSVEIYTMLKNKKVKYLYHANTLTTAITFIEQGALLSRQYVESNKLNQTPQKSDCKDKLFDIWDNVFVDGTDMHKTYSRSNFYGPVLFRLNLELLLSPFLSTIFVTKNNPIYWTNSSNLNSRYYSCVEDIYTDYLTGRRIDSSIMFTFRRSNNKIGLRKYLHSIIIDKPDCNVRTSNGLITTAGDYCDQKIRDSLQMNGLEEITVHQRHKNGESCFCYNDYMQLYNLDKEEFKKRFNYQKPNL